MNEIYDLVTAAEDFGEAGEIDVVDRLVSVAGLRVVDVRNLFEPTEVGYCIPATTPNTDQRCVTIDGVESCKIAIQTNNVEVDDRGLIYLVDRANTGLHVVELTGPAAAIIEPFGKGSSR